uniref:Putative ribonuclease H-like domain-containing protein n=1 Tax=Tanacetum cinerariifolium TaxID=118510 RepID=A0A6L2MQ08_TANCI|nr:putative ribonuclease H-like domain-containing protein [Tanacetum cinerariifolium]
MYCLVVTDDYSRFTWAFSLATKDETSAIIKPYITRIENIVDHKVKVIICDNRTEFKNRELNKFCEIKGIMRQFSVARTPQQNRGAERRNRTLIEAAKIMLVDSKVGGKKVIISEASIRRDLQFTNEERVDCLPNSTIFEQLVSMRKPTRKVIEVPQPSEPIENVADEAVYKELDDRLVRVATTASSLEAEKDNGNINRTQSKATPNESSSQGTSSGGGPRCQEAIGDTIAQTRFENVSKLSNDLLLARGERIDDINANEDITLVNVQADAEMFDVDKDLGGEEVFVKQEVIADKEKIDEVTLA